MLPGTRLGAWLRSGEGIGWLAAGTMPNSLYRVPFAHLFLACVFCYSCSFLFDVFVCVFFCSHWSLVDVPLIFFCPADHVVPDWQPRIILLGMVEARSVNVKKITTTKTWSSPRAMSGLRLPDTTPHAQNPKQQSTRLDRTRERRSIWWPTKNDTHVVLCLEQINQDDHKFLKSPP